MAYNTKKLAALCLASALLVIALAALVLASAPMVNASSGGISGYAGTRSLPKVKNVIIMIGDGMGLSHVRLTQVVYGKLYMELFPVTGILYTDSLSGVVPDSAATATALATGFKTWNRVIAMAPNSEGCLVNVTTLLELAEALGKSTGVITTTRVTHATPAAFVAHVPNRHMEETIAEQMLSSGVDVIMGGGLKYFNGELLEEARRKGYAVVLNKEQLESLHGAKRVLGLFSWSHIPFVLDRNESIPSLPEMVAKAIDVLDDNPNGFVLVVEGGRIDHAAHCNDAPSVVAETKEFDDAVGVALAYALRRNDTLVVVLADHETGGLTVGGYGYGNAVNTTLLINARASAERLAEEIAKGADPKEVIRKYIGITISEEEASSIKAALKKSFYEGVVAIGRIISRRAGIAWATTKHTGQPIPVFAYGPGSELFQGVHHQVDVAKAIAALMLFGGRNIAPATLTLRASTPGDVDGDRVVGPSDAYTVLMYFLGRAASTPIEKRFDVNGNGVIDLGDVYLIYNGASLRIPSRTLLASAPAST